MNSKKGTWAMQKMKRSLNTLRASVQYIHTSNFGLENSSFRLLYQHHSSADCAKELFKGSN